jgi:ATP/ADP translocase
MAAGQCELCCILRGQAVWTLYDASCEMLYTPLASNLRRKAESVAFVEIFILKFGMEHRWLLLPKSRTG